MGDTFYSHGQYFNSWEEFQDFLEAEHERLLREEPDYYHDAPDPFEDR